MGLCAFIGDELSAAGFRLAGVDVHVPEPVETAALFQRLAAQAQIILMTAEVAQRLPEDTLRRTILADLPLVLVIPDIRGRQEPPDMAAALRRQLGMAE